MAICRLWHSRPRTCVRSAEDEESGAAGVEAHASTHHTALAGHGWATEQAATAGNQPAPGSVARNRLLAAPPKEPPPAGARQAAGRDSHRQQSASSAAHARSHSGGAGPPWTAHHPSAHRARPALHSTAGWGGRGEGARARAPPAGRQFLGWPSACAGRDRLPQGALQGALRRWQAAPVAAAACEPRYRGTVAAPRHSLGSSTIGLVCVLPG